jgi:N-acetylglucosaminyldiphosphoundecaprenol N-acetyl-beta-D-mannosaminyltransferase
MVQPETRQSRSCQQKIMGTLPTVEILGVKIHNVVMGKAIECIEEMIHSGKSNLVITLGTEMVMVAQNNPNFRDLVNRSPLVLPDGGGLLWASKVLGTPLQERIAGIDLLESLCKLSQEKQWKIFFLGGKPGIAELASQKIRIKFPKINILGTHHGFFSQTEISSILKNQKPDILFAGLGAPRQEFWLEENLHAFGIPVGIGVGGSFDVLAGKLRRAPAWMMQLYLEWLFRFYQEPKRFRRIMKIPLFMLRIYARRSETLFQEQK